MKYSLHLLTLLLAVALVVLSVGLLFSDDQPKEQTQSTNITGADPVDETEVILNSIMTRTSVRKYTQEVIPADAITTILKAGMAAPTAGNRQPWRYIVVNDTNIIKQFIKVSKYTEPMNEIAKTAIIVCGVPSESFPDGPTYWVQDCSAATQNILLATHAMGYGAVWCGVHPGGDRVEALRNILNIPQELVPLNIIMMGVPDADPVIKNKWDASKVQYVK